MQASTAVVAASAIGEEVAVAAVKARQLGLPCCFACRAASVKTMAMAKAKAKFAAPLGAGKVDDGSGSLLRSLLRSCSRSGSGSATLSDRDLTGLLDGPPGAVTIAAPLGAGKGAVGCGAFFRSFLSCGQRSGPAGICVSSQDAAKAF
jgi:hypothetical protein